MGFRAFDSSQLSRRSLFRTGGYLAAGSALASMPLGRGLLAHDVSSDWSHVAERIEHYVGSGKVANMVASFGWGDSRPHSVARGSLKFGGSRPADLDSLYRIYSMTKPITGMAAMMLIEDGVMGLDQPIADFLPGFAKMQVLTAPDAPLDSTVPAERPITIRNLMTHTAGLGYDIISRGPLLAAYRELGLNGGQVSRAQIPGIFDFTPAPGLDAWAERLATLPLIAQPGTVWSYSVSLDLLGRVIEVASGQRFDQFLHHRLFEPCGMNSTFFRVPQSEIARYTDNYGIAEGVPVPIDPANVSIYLDNPPIFWGGSGLVSSPHDYDRFLKMLLGYGKIDGVRVMGELAVRVGTSNILPRNVKTEGTWVAGQGFGAGGRVVGRTYGWGGAAGTLASVDFDAGLRAGLFVQYMPSDSYPIRDDFLTALAKDMGKEGGAFSIGG